MFWKTYLVFNMICYLSNILLLLFKLYDLNYILISALLLIKNDFDIIINIIVSGYVIEACARRAGLPQTVCLVRRSRVRESGRDKGGIRALGFRIVWAGFGA